VEVFMDSVYGFIAEHLRLWLIILLICVATIFLSVYRIHALNILIRDPHKHRRYRRNKRSLDMWILMNELAQKMGVATLALFLGGAIIKIARFIFF
jgi:hypothetical protein